MGRWIGTATVIEVALIVTPMLSGGPKAASLPRDTVFAAVMITCNGIGGFRPLLGALRYRVTMFTSALALLWRQGDSDDTEPGDADLHHQPSWAGILARATGVRSGRFARTIRRVRAHQTVRHRDFFLPLTSDGLLVEAEEHADPPSTRAAVASLLLLVVALVAVVGLASSRRL